MSVEQQKEDDVRSLIQEAVHKFVKGIRGIENLHGINITDFEWQVDLNSGEKYQIYFEQLGVKKK